MDIKNDFYGPSKDEIIARHRKKTRKVRKKGTKKKARRRRIYKSKASKRFIDTFNGGE